MNRRGGRNDEGSSEFECFLPDDSDVRPSSGEGRERPEKTMSMSADPLVETDNATCWYYEGPAGEQSKVRHEGKVEVYENWVYLGMGHWVPRERVEQVTR